MVIQNISSIPMAHEQTLPMMQTRQWLTNVTTTGPNGPVQDVSYTRSVTGRIDQIDGSWPSLMKKTENCDWYEQSYFLD